MSRPKLLDLFCCAGGAGMGYNRAGFDIYGVDIKPQPNYPFWFHQGNALKVAETLLMGRSVTFTRPETRFAPLRYRHLHLSDVSLGHGSPPCQSYSDLAHRNGNADDWPRLIGATRRLFQRMGIPYVIENVAGAEVDMLDPVTLCGTMFPGLRVLRHRLFETNWDLRVPPHGKHPLVFTHDKRKAHYGQLDQNTSFVQVTGGGNCSVANAKDAMGIDWMTKNELNEALPPAYTEVHRVPMAGAACAGGDGLMTNPLYKAPDVVLTVDHVQPTALGGSDLPENLVAACKDCNAGKTSMKPGSEVVADASESALRWADRMRKLLADAATDILALQERRDDFRKMWERWGIKGVPLEMPPDWRQSVDHWDALDVPMEIIEYAIETAMTSTKVKHPDKWRYMCGVIWRKIDAASKAAEEERVEDDVWTTSVDLGEQYGWTLAYDMFAYNDKVNRCLVDLIDGRRSDYMRWVA